MRDYPFRGRGRILSICLLTAALVGGQGPHSHAAPSSLPRFYYRWVWDSRQGTQAFLLARDAAVMRARFTLETTRSRTFEAAGAVDGAEYSGAVSGVDTPTGGSFRGEMGPGAAAGMLQLRGHPPIEYRAAELRPTPSAMAALTGSYRMPSPSHRGAMVELTLDGSRGAFSLVGRSSRGTAATTGRFIAAQGRDGQGRTVFVIAMLPQAVRQGAAVDTAPFLFRAGLPTGGHYTLGDGTLTLKLGVLPGLGSRVTARLTRS